MVNNPELINKMINNINKLDDETIKEAIQEVEKEDMEEDILEKLELLKKAGCKMVKCKVVDKNIKLNKKIIELKNNSIPISVIQNKIDEIIKYRDLAKELIEERVVIADSDSLNYGRAEAHDKDIQVLQELLEERNK